MVNNRLYVIGACVKGASHKLNGKPCQDNIKYKFIEKDTVILAVADGHGSEKSPFSEDGSKAAVDAFHTVTRRYINSKGKGDSLRKFLGSEKGTATFAREITKDWKQRVRKLHRINGREEISQKQDLLLKYGSTLLGLLITDSFYFAFQIGDGDIVIVYDKSDESDKNPNNDYQAEHIINIPKILGVETHSLCVRESWTTALTELKTRPEIPHAFMLSTDGLSNSYRDEKTFLFTCRDYYKAIINHGTNTVWGKLNTWLEETSRDGSGDDISLIIAYDENL